MQDVVGAVPFLPAQIEGGLAMGFRNDAAGADQDGLFLLKKEAQVVFYNDFLACVQFGREKGQLIGIFVLSYIIRLSGRSETRSR